MYPPNPYAPPPYAPPPPMAGGMPPPPMMMPGGYPPPPPGPMGPYGGGPGFPPPPGLGEVGFLPFFSPIAKLVGGLFNRPKPRPPVMMGPGSAVPTALPALPELFYRNRPQFCQIFCPPNQPGAQAGQGRGRRRRRRGSRLGEWGWYQ